MIVAAGARLRDADRLVFRVGSWRADVVEGHGAGWAAGRRSPVSTPSMLSRAASAGWGGKADPTTEGALAALFSVVLLGQA
jgi:hypothetical protein